MTMGHFGGYLGIFWGVPSEKKGGTLGGIPALYVTVKLYGPITIQILKKFNCSKFD
jgi:hypothetical protein